MCLCIYCACIELYFSLLCYRTACYCKETCSIDNLTIPKGCHVVIPIHVIHTSPEYWDQPELFKPERYCLCVLTIIIQ